MTIKINFRSTFGVFRGSFSLILQLQMFVMYFLRDILEFFGIIVGFVGQFDPSKVDKYFKCEIFWPIIYVILYQFYF